MKIGSFLQRVMFATSLLFAVLLFLACIVPHTASASLAFISLTVPLLVFINALYFLYWLLQKKWAMLLPFFVLIYGYFSLGTFITFNGTSGASEPENELSIMSFNSIGFRGKNEEWENQAGDTIVRFIRKEDPDIICFQEFDYRKIRSTYFEEYPFRFVDFEFGVDRERVILAIYSKYKIINKGIIEFPKSSNSAIFADVVIRTDTLRMYNLHLQSLRVRPSSIKRERSDRLFSRLRKSFEKQLEQSQIVRQHINESPYRNLLGGDFNNTQFSNPYFTIKGDLKDSFLEQGNGYGSTIDFWRFPFRIDFILVDPSFEVLSHKNYNIQLSDHEPIMASIKIGTDE